MGTKENPGKYDCYANLKPREPYFLVNASHLMCAPTIRLWAAMRAKDWQLAAVEFQSLMLAAGYMPDADPAKIAEARKCAEDCRDWLLAEMTSANAAAFMSAPMPHLDGRVAREKMLGRHDDITRRVEFPARQMGKSETMRQQGFIVDRVLSPERSWVRCAFDAAKDFLRHGF